MREKFARFMAGRYGMDTMGRFTIGLALFLVVINYIFTSRIINLLVWILLILAYYRMFSRNVYKRSSENQVFLNKTYKIRHWFYTQKILFGQRKTHHIYRCPSCKQKTVYQEARARLRSAVQSVTPHLSKRAKESSHVRIHCN